MGGFKPTYLLCVILGVIPSACSGNKSNSDQTRDYFMPEDNPLNNDNENNNPNPSESGGEGGSVEGTPAEITPGDFSGEISFPGVAVDSSGNAFFTWNALRSGLLVTYVRRHLSNGSWEEPLVLGSGQKGAITPPETVIDSSGNAFVIWEQTETVEGKVTTRLYSKKYSPANNWEETKKIDSFGGTILGHTAAMDANGRVVVAWREKEADSTAIYSSTYGGDGNESWRSPVSLAGNLDIDDNASPEGFLSSALLAHVLGDKTMVVWIQNKNIYYSSFVAGPGETERKWSPPIQLNNPDIPSSSPWLVKGGNQVITTWLQEGGSALFTRKYDVNSGTFSPEIDTIYQDAGSGPVGSYHLAMNRVGRGIIVWDHPDANCSMADCRSVYLKEYNGSTWSETPTLVETDDQNSNYSPRGIINDSGTSFIVWVNQQISGIQVLQTIKF